MRTLAGLLFCSASLLAQSVPAYIPNQFPDPAQFSALTASRSRQLPPTWAADKGSEPANFGKLHKLSPLTRRANPTRVKPGLNTGGESRLPDQSWRDGWQSRTLRDGSTLWRVAIQSPGAGGLRFHFQNFNMDGQSLWIYPQSASKVPQSILGPFTASGPNTDGEFWSGTIFSDTAIFEVLTPAGSENPPTLDLDRILHLYPFATTNTTPQTDQPTPRPASIPNPAQDPLAANNAVVNAAACAIDATCYPQYNNLASATLHFSFVSSDGFSYVCSGAMINTRNSSLRPYVSTASHCISTDAEARSVEAYFGYASRSCNVSPVMREDAFRVAGARYLAGGGWDAGDFALLLLNGAPPPGTVFLGWNASDMPFRERFLGIHYPRGSWRRVALGARTPDKNASIDGQLVPGNFYYQMTYSLGLTESGSSGSPIMTEAGAIFGVLSYGPITPSGRSICDFPTQTAAYGRFSNAYPAYRPFLEDEAAPALSLSNSTVVFNVESGAFIGPSSSTVSLSSTSTTPTPFTLTSSAPWIIATTSTNQVQAGTPANLTITINRTFFTTSGIQTGTVRVASGTLVPLTINVTANITIRESRVILSVNPNPVLQSDPDPDGFTFFYSVNAAETAGVATQLTSLSIDGTDYSSRILDWFESTTLNANVTLQTALRGRNIRVPAQLVFVLGGTDTVTRRTWSRSITVPFNPKPARAQISLLSLPTQVQQNPGSSDCSWLQYLVVTEQAGFPIKLTKFTAGGDDLSAELADYFDDVNISARGATVGGICWTGVRPPDIINVEVEGTDPAGTRVTAKVSTRFVGPIPNPARSSTPVSDIDFSALSTRTAAIAPIQLPLNFSRSGVPWTARLVMSQKESSWLNVGPLSGSGSTILSLSASLTGVTAGTYYATLFVESAQTLPQSLAIPISLRVLAPRTPPVLASGGVVHNASYNGPLTPGALASAFGTNLSAGADIASRIPLPTTLGVTSAKVNGRPAPLLYAGAGQINFQIPWETETGNATLSIDVAGQTSQTSFAVASVNPGIYTSDGRRLVPANTANRSSIILAFVTGIGAVTPSVATGNAPDGSIAIANLPQPLGRVTATVANQNARILFAAIPYGLVGLMQVNLEIPATVPVGEQALIISIGGQASPPAYLTIR